MLAQTASGEFPELGSTLSADFIQDLPTSDNLFQLLETTQAALITDRFLGGGLYAGQPARVGGFLSSWSQTLFRLGDVSITDPNGGPLLFPGLAVWESVTVATGMLGRDVDAVGLALSLQPRRPTAAWMRTIEAMTSHFADAPHGSSPTAPPVARLHGWDRATVVASGPIVRDRLGLVAAGSWTRGSQFERADTSAVDSQVAAGFAHLVFTPTSHDEVRTIGWMQQSTRPFDYRLPFSQPGATTSARAGHAQSTWEHRGPEEVPWRAHASYSRRHQTPAFDPSGIITIDRLSDGPVSGVAGVAADTFHRWSIGGRVGNRTTASPAPRHRLQLGVEADGSGTRAADFLSGEVRELVDGVRARIWRFRNPGLESFRHEMGVAAYLSDRIAITPRLHVDVGVRYDSVSGSAQGAETGIRWRSVLPRAGLHWAIGGGWLPAIFASYAQSAYRLPLDWLAFGDPAAPTADVFRWDAAGVALSPLVARVGPGPGNNPAFSRIETGLKRPRADEVVLGVELIPAKSVRLRLTGMTRSERDLVGLINTGAEYDRLGVFDPGANVGSPEDDRLVLVYDRRPESFGLDQWLVTNLGLSDSTFEGLEFTADVNTQRATLVIGGTAGRSQTSGSSRGFGPLENDQGLIGEIAADPNALTFSRGRPFADRAYTAKVVGVFRLPTATTLGLVARYQDGQPFSRMLVFPALNQGAEAVRAFASGDSRFMFTGTLDARIQQRITLGARRLVVVLDAYNLLGLSYSVEERSTQLPDVRVTTAVQPPRTLHLGVRLTF